MGFGIPVAYKWFETTEFSLQKSYVLAEIAESAYLDETNFGRLAMHWGVTDWRFLNRNSAQAYLFMLNNNAFISFRGTEPDQIHDLLANTAVLKINMREDSHGSVHSGFMKEVAKLWVDIQTWLGDHEFDHVYFTGHSLGGAMATIAQVWYDKPDITSCYTFGAPRVGDKKFKLYVERTFKSYRIVNNTDIVARLPFKLMGYRHAGKLVFMDSEGDIVPYGWKNKWLHIILAILNRRSIIKRVLVDGLTDHYIREYKLNLQKYILHDPELVAYYARLIDR